jgi:hypothetical protein
MPQPKRTWTRCVRPLRFAGAVAFAPLPDGREAVIDAADAHLVQHHNWSAGDGCVRSGLGRLQNVILGVSSMVDHKDGDWLNNRRGNLRPATPTQNAQNRALASNNSSGFKGVSFRRDRGTFLAAIRVDGRLRKLGTFATAEAAALAYDEAARSEFGEFGALNFPREGERPAFAQVAA